MPPLIGNLIAILLVAVSVFFALRQIVKDHKAGGCGSCKGGCAGCSKCGCASCGKSAERP